MPQNKDLQLLALTRHFEEATVRLAAYDAVLSAPLDNYTIQSCCICYGGSSSPGAITDALKCYREIIQSRIDEKLSPTP